MKRPFVNDCKCLLQTNDVGARLLFEQACKSGKIISQQNYGE
jgi:hypothetical protein